MNKELKSIPQFNNEDEEQSFWAAHDSTDYIDWSQAERDFTFPNLKRSTRTDSTDDEHKRDTEIGTDNGR